MSFFISVISAVAAVIAAIPVIRGWFPLRLSVKETDILKLALGTGSECPLSLLYVSGAGKAYVQIPFRHGSSIPVFGEISSLLSKKLIMVQHVENRQGIQNHMFMWIMLTDKGLAVANKYHRRVK